MKFSQFRKNILLIVIIKVLDRPEFFQKFINDIYCCYCYVGIVQLKLIQDKIKRRMYYNGLNTQSDKHCLILHSRRKIVCYFYIIEENNMYRACGKYCDVLKKLMNS